jgi:hypothetical protein
MSSTKWLYDRAERVLEQHRNAEADKGHIPGKLAYLDASGLSGAGHGRT